MLNPVQPLEYETGLFVDHLEVLFLYCQLALLCLFPTLHTYPVQMISGRPQRIFSLSRQGSQVSPCSHGTTLDHP